MTEKQLYLHTSNRVESLAKRLVEVSLAQPLARSLSQETVMTLNPGIARWLQFEIANQCGVSFGWDFPLPGKLFARVIRGFEPSFSSSGAFPEELAQWQLNDILAKLEPQTRFDQVRSYCQAAGPTRKFAFAQRLTRMFDEYLVYRPDTVVDWEDRPDESFFDWQAELWRRLKKAIFPTSNQPRHIARVWSEMRRGQLLELNLAPQVWPERLFVFGVSSLAPMYLDFLDELSHYRPVHVFLLQPSDLYWADLKTSKQIHKIAKKAAAKNRSPASLPSPEDWLFETGNPLLPSLGKQSQMFLDLLIDKDPIQDDSTFSPPDSEYSQLSALQSDLFTIENRDLSKGVLPLPDFDGSIQIHSCSSRRREVETVWDLLVERFDSNPSLKPNEILVMAPDIQVYRSHIEAVFEAKRKTNLEIPFSIADGNAGNKPGVFSGIHSILQSISGRATSSEILELLETPLLREAFSLSDQDIERIEFWIRELGITWGWNAKHRDQHESFATDRNTWREFKTRLLAGMTFSHDATIPIGFIAYPEVEGDGAFVAARTVECLDLLFDLRFHASQSHPLDFWQRKLLALLDSLKTERDDWQSHFQQSIELIRETIPELSGTFATGTEVYRALCEKLENAPSGGGYLSGGVTFCSLKPMRAIPADTVVLMGMNRTDFPRRANRLSFDLLAREPRIGDRNTREDDRQLFLETLLSVRNRLYLTFQGISPTSDTPLEPSAVLEELITYLKRGLSEAESSKLFFHHKRQSFDSTYFASERLWTYDPDRSKLLNRISAPQEPIEKKEPIVSVNQSPEPFTYIDLDTLIRFFAHPAQFFIQNIAQLKLARLEEPLSESDPLFSDGLDRYKIRHELASLIASGQPIATLSTERLAQQKLLPVGKLEQPTLSYEIERARAIEVVVQPTTSTSYFARFETENLVISGEVQIREQDGRQLLLHSGDIKAKRVLYSWIRHLFALTSVPAFSGETIIVSLHEKPSPIRFGHIDQARKLLEEIIELYLAGQSSPLPLFGEISQKLAAASFPEEMSDEEQLSLLLATAEKDLRLAQLPSDYPRTFSWDNFYRLCFGDNFTPGDATVNTALALWKPCLENLKNTTLDALASSEK